MIDGVSVGLGFFFDFPPPGFGKERADEPIDQKEHEDEGGHPFVVQGGEDQNDNNGEELGDGALGAPIEGFETWVAHTAEHHEGQKEQEGRENKFPGAEVT